MNLSNYLIGTITENLLSAKHWNEYMLFRVNTVHL